jgi:hypothetical protein
MTMRIALLALATVSMAAADAAAQPADPALQGLANCAAMLDPAQKASCYDAAYSALNGAVRAGEITLIQKKEAQAARRGAFGFNLPSLAILDKVAKDEGPADVLTDTIKDARLDHEGNWTIVLADGAVWKQTDKKTLAPRPKPGQTVEIRKAALSSFFLKVADLPAVRARRVE